MHKRLDQLERSKEHSEWKKQERSRLKDVGGENRLPQKPYDLHVCAKECLCPHPKINKQIKKNDGKIENLEVKEDGQSGKKEKVCFCKCR